MITRKVLDGRPGALPVIHAQGTDVVFQLNIAGVGRDARLVLRCDANGSIWVSIREDQ
jgi:hypothetical protein